MKNRSIALFLFSLILVTFNCKPHSSSKKISTKNADCSSIALTECEQHSNCEKVTHGETSHCKTKCESIDSLECATHDRCELVNNKCQKKIHPTSSKRVRKSSDMSKSHNIRINHQGKLVKTKHPDLKKITI